jgi:phage tail sheath protein FI
VTLAGGKEDDPANVTAAQFNAGIDALLPIDEVNLLCVPDATDNAVQMHMIAHCEQLKDRFALLDPRRGLTPAQVQAQRDGLGSDKGFGAIYYPWIVVSGPSGRITVPPSGALAGLIARVDGERGVFKAPANAVLRTALDLERQVTADEQGILNTNHVNVIRMFRGRGRVVWGARTISTSTQWQYVNVRRFVTFVEESLVEGTQFVVFEPNTPALWEAVKRQVSEFLMRQWTAGALVGTTPEQAFRVRADLELNPPDQQALGILVFQVELAPAAPAEFIVFRVIQQPGRPLVEE